MNSPVYFIADVHLEGNDTDKRSLFLSFLEMVKERKGNLYILGDLFDYWANNRRVMKDNKTVLNALGELSHLGSQVGFLIGNRDLLLGKKVLSRYGIDALGENRVIELQGKSILLTHGHLLCTDDVSFQKYRKRMWPFYRMLDALLPGCIENTLARLFIQRSKQVIGAQEAWRFQFSDDVIEAAFQRGIDMIICGHAHKPTVRHFDGDRSFIVLPHWTSRSGGYLYMKDGAFQVRAFPVHET
jgi:UDP-2,3-diacylglucosamine hydrolase